MTQELPIAMLIVGIFFLLHIAAIQKIIPYFVPIFFTTSASFSLQAPVSPLIKLNLEIIATGILFGALLFVLSALIAKNNLKAAFSIIGKEHSLATNSICRQFVNVAWEELFWRFCMMDLLENNLLNIGIVAFFFASAHLPKIKCFSEFGDLIITSATLSVFYSLSNSIWAAIIAHLVRNLLVIQINSASQHRPIKD